MPHADRFADFLGAASGEIAEAGDLDEALAGAVFLDHIGAEGVVESVGVDTGSAHQIVAAGTARKPIRASALLINVSAPASPARVSIPS